MIKKLSFIIVVYLFSCSNRDIDKLNTENSTNTSKPYTYWWWQGNAVDSANIAYNLEMMHNAGIGGVHIPLRKAIAQWNKAKSADLDCMGHWHTRENSKDYCINDVLW